MKCRSRRTGRSPYGRMRDGADAADIEGGEFCTSPPCRKSLSDNENYVNPIVAIVVCILWEFAGRTVRIHAWRSAGNR